MEFQDKVILITGASSGIGKATAITLAKKGMKVALAARDEHALNKVAKQIGKNAIAIPTDATEQAAVDNLVETTISYFGKIDVLFANAGVFIGGEILNGDLDYFEKGLQVNLMGSLRVIQKAVPELIKNKTGHVLLTTSVAGHRYVPGQAVYCASKHAQYMIARGLRNELLEHNIKVTTIAPGWVDSEFWDDDPEIQLAANTAKKDGKVINTQNVVDGIIFALEQPDNVNIGDIIIQPIRQEH